MTENMRNILTHRNPDLDAIVGAWLAQDFLFASEKSRVIFVSRKIPNRIEQTADCIVDVGNSYDPGHYLFDHKPPGIKNRNSSCASKLLYEYLLSLGRDVGHLESLIQVTFEGDTRRQTARVKDSRQSGPHARLKHLKEKHKEDSEVYACMIDWLRSYYGQR